MDLNKELDRLELMADAGIAQLAAVKTVCQRLRYSLSNQSTKKAVQNRTTDFSPILTKRLSKLKNRKKCH